MQYEVVYVIMFAIISLPTALLGLAAIKALDTNRDALNRSDRLAVAFHEYADSERPFSKREFVRVVRRSLTDSDIQDLNLDSKAISFTLAEGKLTPSVGNPVFTGTGA